MNKYRQCMYTVILILTCLVASPFIFKQIWVTSSVKQPKAPKKEPAVSTVEPTSEAATTQQPDETDEKGSAPSETSGQTATQPVTSENVDFSVSSADYFDDALFIGDSRTVGIKEYGTLKNADYFCSQGLASYKLSSEYIDGYTFSDKLSSQKYGKVYIMLGINEVAMDIEYTISQFRSVLETVRSYQPDAVIYLQANLHVTIAAQTENITNEGIDLLNSRLRELADENENVYFIDINEVFDDETGALTPDFSSDGIHVLGKYYENWCEWLCQHTVSDGSVQSTSAAAATESSYEEDSDDDTEQSYYDESYDNSYDSYDDNSYYNDYDDEY